MPASDGGDDPIGIGGPYEGFGIIVGFLEEAVGDRQVLLLSVRRMIALVPRPSGDCQEFRAGLGMIGAKEPAHAATQRASYT